MTSWLTWSSKMNKQHIVLKTRQASPNTTRIKTSTMASIINQTKCTIILKVILCNKCKTLCRMDLHHIWINKTIWAWAQIKWCKCNSLKTCWLNKWMHLVCNKMDRRQCLCNHPLRQNSKLNSKCFSRCNMLSNNNNINKCNKCKWCKCNNSNNYNLKIKILIRSLIKAIKIKYHNINKVVEVVEEVGAEVEEQVIESNQLSNIIIQTFNIHQCVINN